ncbi:amidohydrolase [Anaerobranca californiensis DSM 14826]|uniref:Peptidase M20 domain-containing protein 2 n=1 Tax=Anaerobranca californiensis DSM 14826 TaxID=1120989 RepID=A0A1M6NX59_9FIRM|nr:M20 family metallopeptidase [Anaerobranca californiensis]SHK00273.1 amidohydrolase [Anaerobranca californiensis DSM 14826]
MKDKILKFIGQREKEYFKLARYIWENPELGNQEYKAMDKLMEKLQSEGFIVEKGTAGLKTAFTAWYGGEKSGPTIALLAEYDALPQLGHGCGHNLIGVGAVLAAVSLKESVDLYGGKIMVIGTPAEETDGGKVIMVEKGVFDSVDVAMMIHPASSYESSGTSLAMEALQFDFYGKAAHGAASPHKGINALDAIVNMYVAISTLRQQLTSDIRIHGIISKGGEAANIIPDHTQGRYYVRAKEKDNLKEVIKKVKNCAHAAALATGCTVEISNYELSYDNLVSNAPLSQLFDDNLIQTGVSPDEIHKGLEHGSLDMGNVSQVVPAIHPYIKICEENIPAHTLEFKEAAGSEQGFNLFVKGIQALALTAFDLLSRQELVEEIKKEHKR